MPIWNALRDYGNGSGKTVHGQNISVIRVGG